MAELVDARDLKSLDSNIISVRLRLLAPLYPYNSMVEYATFNRVIPVQLWVGVPIWCVGEVVNTPPFHGGIRGFEPLTHHHRIRIWNG